MNSNPKMAIETTRELFHALVKTGASSEVLVRESGIDLDELEKSESRYPVKYHLDLWKAGENIIMNAVNGIQMGAASDPYSRGIVGLIFAASRNLEDAISSKVKYTKILADHINLSFEKDNNHFSINYSILENCFHRYEVERVFAGFLNWVRVFVGSQVYPTSLSFQYARPNNIRVYEKHFQCPMTFDQAKNTICFDSNLLKIESKQYNDYLFSILKARAESVLATLDCQADFVENIKSMIAGRLCNGNFSIEEVAISLNMSKRTLQRKLNEENLVYQSLLDEIRQSMAISYLLKGECSINNIPFLVGYSDTRSFSRAFKRWTGLTANEYYKKYAA